MNHDTLSTTFNDFTEIVTNATCTTKNNKTDERNRNKEITTTLDDNNNKNNIEFFFSITVNEINMLINH